MKKSILVNADELTNYIKDLRKIPVITHERQEIIFNLLNNKNTTKFGSDTSPASSESDVKTK